MIKKVNVYPLGGPITALAIPIRSMLTGAELDTKDIKKIILGGGAVKEIMPDGTLVSLDLQNYDDPKLFENNKKAKEAAEAARVQEKIEEAKIKKEVEKREQARAQAIANFHKDAAAAAVKKRDIVQGKALFNNNKTVTATKEEPKKDDKTAQQQAVEAARAKIEANKAAAGK